MRTYQTHNNGDRPFLVEIQDKTIKVYGLNNKVIDDDNFQYTEYPIFTFLNNIEIFIGKSPKNKTTEYSGSYGDKFDGNSILINISGNKYIYIGSTIYSFESQAKILKYISPIGNSDVPYPYAIDEKENIYLMTEDVILEKMKNVDFNDFDPYEYYYEISYITDIEKEKEIFKNIEKYFIGGEEYNLTYCSNPEKNYDRISSWEEFGIGMEIKYIHQEKEPLTKNKYIEIINQFGNVKGIFPIKNINLI